jgi:hypothetical protein
MPAGGVTGEENVIVFAPVVPTKARFENVAVPVLSVCTDVDPVSVPSGATTAATVVEIGWPQLSSARSVTGGLITARFAEVTLGDEVTCSVASLGTASPLPVNITSVSPCTVALALCTPTPYAHTDSAVPSTPVATVRVSIFSVVDNDPPPLSTANVTEVPGFGKPSASVTLTFSEEGAWVKHLAAPPPATAAKIAGGPGATTSFAVPVTPSDVAAIAVTPGLSVVTTPELLTFAIAELVLLQVTARPVSTVPDALFTAAVKEGLE